MASHLPCPSPPGAWQHPSEAVWPEEEGGGGGGGGREGTEGKTKEEEDINFICADTLLSFNHATCSL